MYSVAQRSQAMESQSDSDSSEDLLPSLAGKTVKIRKGRRRDKSSTQSSTSDHTTSDHTFSGSECSDTSSGSEDYSDVLVGRGRGTRGMPGRGGRSLSGRSIARMKKTPRQNTDAMTPEIPIAMETKRRGPGRPPKRRVGRTSVKRFTESSDSSDGEGGREGGEEWESAGVRRSNRSTRGKGRRRWSGDDDLFLPQASKKRKGNPPPSSKGESPNLLSDILGDIPEVDIRPTSLTKSENSTEKGLPQSSKLIQKLPSTTGFVLKKPPNAISETSNERSPQVHRGFHVGGHPFILATDTQQPTLSPQSLRRDLIFGQELRRRALSSTSTSLLSPECLIQTQGPSTPQRDSDVSVFSPLTPVAKSDTPGVKIPDKGDFEMTDQQVEGPEDDASMTDHCKSLRSWEEDVARGSKALRGPTLYAAEKLTMELAEMKGSWMNKARFIARTWRRLSAEERDVFAVRAKRNRKSVTAAGKTKSSPKFLGKQKNARDSAESANMPSQVIHYQPTYTAQTPQSTVPLSTIGDFTPMSGGEASKGVLSNSQGVNASSRKQPINFIAQTLPKDVGSSRLGPASYGLPNTNSVVDGKIKKKQMKTSSKVHTTPVSNGSKEFNSTAIPFTPPIFSCLQPSTLFPAAFPLQFPSIPPNIAFQMFARESQPAAFMQPAMPPVSLSIPVATSQPNPSTPASALPPTAASNAVISSQDSGQNTESRKTDDLCSAIDKEIETLAETLAVSPNDDTQPACPAHPPHSTSIPCTPQALSTPSCVSITNNTPSPTNVPSGHRNVATQEMQASPTKLASAVLPSPSQISDFCTNLKSSFPISSICTVAASSDSIATSNCEGTTGTSIHPLSSSSYHSAGSSANASKATKTKKSSKGVSAKEKKGLKDAPHTKKTVIKGRDSKLESQVHSDSKKVVCSPPLSSANPADEIPPKKLADETLSREIPPTQSLELPPAKRPLNSDPSSLLTSLAISIPAGTSVSTAKAKTAVAPSTTGLLATSRNVSVGFPSSMQSGALFQTSPSNRVSSTGTFSIPSAMSLSSADSSVSTTQPKAPSLGLPHHLSALPPNSSQQSHAATPSGLLGIGNSMPVRASSTDTMISMAHQRKESDGKFQQGIPTSSSTWSAMGTLSEGRTTPKSVVSLRASVTVASKQECLPTALPSASVSKDPSHSGTMALSFLPHSAKVSQQESSEQSNSGSIPPSFSSNIAGLPFSIFPAKMLPPAFIPQFPLPIVSSLSQQGGTCSPSMVTASLSSIPSVTASSNYNLNVLKKVQELNLASLKQQETAGDKAVEPVPAFPHIVETFSSSRQRKKMKRNSGEVKEHPLGFSSNEKGKGKSKHSKKSQRKTSGHSSISSIDGALGSASRHTATSPTIQNRFQMVGAELLPMTSAPLARPDDAYPFSNPSPLVASTPKCFGDVDVQTDLPKLVAAHSPGAGNPTVLMNSSFPFMPDSGMDEAEVERLYLHNLAVLKQQEQYTKMLGQHLLKMRRKSKSSKKPTQIDVYKQFLSFVVEPSCVPDIPISIPGFNPECTRSIELKGTFDKPILSSTHDVYASFGRT